MRRLVGVLVLAAALLAGGCISRVEQQLVAFPGLARQLEAFYRDRAFEQGAMCTRPSMTVTDARIVEQTQDRLVVAARYVYESIDGGGGNPAFQCRGFGERLFTVARGPQGTSVVAMTGEQRS